MMKLTTLRAFMLLLLAATMSGCSLLKVTIATEDKPLSRAERNTRIASRAFYGAFCSQIIAAADSINSKTDNIATMLSATRWKLQATSAATAAVYQTNPDIAMVNLWVLCCQMDKYMTTAPDSLLFGKLTPIAQSTTHKLAAEIAKTAGKVLHQPIASYMQEFVTAYCESHRVQQGNALASDLALQWIDFVQAKGHEQETTPGTMSEVLNDMTERMSGYAEQYGNTFAWSKDMLELRFKQDSINTNLMAQLDSLTTNFSRITKVAENSPEMLKQISGDLAVQFEMMVTTLNKTINLAFANFEAQRVHLQQFISTEREAIISDATKAAQQTVDLAMAKLPTMIAKLAGIIVAVMVVLFGLPFVLGFVIGRHRGRAKSKKEDKE